MPAKPGSQFPEETAFWSWIDRARTPEGTTEDTRRRLEEFLSGEKTPSLADFQAGLAHAYERAFTPAFWAAAHLLSSGGTRFKMESLVYWLVLQGRERFEAALAHPDVLVDFDPATPLPGPDFREIAARAARSKSKARKSRLEPFDPGRVMMALLADGKWDAMKAAQEAAAESFPRLAEKFWDPEAAEARVRRNRSTIIEFTRRKADAGDGSACETMGSLYYVGDKVVEKDYGRAAAYFDKGAQGGHAGCQVMLGCMLVRGEGMAVNAAQAAVWFGRAADQGDASARHELGLLHLHGNGVPEDVNRAIELLRLAAEAGNVDSQAVVGDLAAAGKKIPKDDAEAFRWYRAAAENGHVGAMFMTGVFLFQARGTVRDDAGAVGWFEKAAEGGDHRALCELGLCYQLGRGVRQSYIRAREFYERGAEHDVGMAVNNLADLYENGLGVARDYRRAARLYHRAADLGITLAKRSLGQFYEQGLGVTRDLKQALHFYEEAAKAGDGESVAHRDRLRAGST